MLMSVYVDELRPSKGLWRFSKSSHMMADTLPELHEFAMRLRLKPEWFQGGKFPHYDLNESKFREAVRWGAQMRTSRWLVQHLVTVKEAS